MTESSSSMAKSERLKDRAMGSLVGLAVGDALGMPTQLMSREDIFHDYGPINSLVAAGPRQIVASGMPAGAITDDTEQALMLAHLFIDGRGKVDEHKFASALLEWEKSMAAKGSLDLLGPSTKKAVERITAGVEASEAGRYGSTNGAAMRIAPIGIGVRPEPLSAFVDAVVDASRVTHNTSIGLAAAAAVGAAVSMGVEGASFAESIATALRAADLAAARGHWVPGGQIGARTAWAIQHMRRTSPKDWAYELDAVVGTDVPAQESVVSAFAIASVAETPWEAVCLAAAVGGDTDTIAAIVGAIVGAHTGACAWPEDVVDQIESVNKIDFQPIVDELLQIRSAK